MEHRETDEEWIARMRGVVMAGLDDSSPDHLQVRGIREIRSLVTTGWCEKTVEQRRLKNQLIVDIINIITVPRWVRAGVRVRSKEEPNLIGTVTELSPGGMRVGWDSGGWRIAAWDTFEQVTP